MRKLNFRQGEVLYSGVTDADGSSQPFHITYYPLGNCLCPKEARPYLEKLGFEINKHWDDVIASRGHFAAADCYYEDGEAPVSSQVLRFHKKQKMNNQELIYLLDK